MLLLKKFPLSPSSNQLYTSVRGRLIKSSEGRRYDSLVEIYRLRELNIIDEWKKTVKPEDVFHIDMYFVFLRERLITKKETIKKLDATNRLKSSHDGLSKILDIDDSRFVTGSFNKVYTRFSHEEQIIILVKKTAMLSLNESMELIKKGV